MHMMIRPNMEVHRNFSAELRFFNKIIIWRFNLKHILYLDINRTRLTAKFQNPQTLYRGDRNHESSTQ